MLIKSCELVATLNRDKGKIKIYFYWIRFLQLYQIPDRSELALVAVVANKSAGQSRRLQSVLVQIGCMIQEDANTPHYNSDDVQTSASQSTCSHGPGRCAAAACSSRWAKHSAEAIVTVP